MYNNALTVKELIEQLQKYPEDYIVVMDNGHAGFPVHATGMIYKDEENAENKVGLF